MNQKDFDNVVEGVLDLAKKTRDEKGRDYAGIEDVLGNFKKRAERLGLSPLKVWGLYFGKHIDAIETFVKTEKLASEPIEMRIVDAINYLLLGYALVQDLERYKGSNKE